MSPKDRHHPNSKQVRPGIHHFTRNFTRNAEKLIHKSLATPYQQKRSGHVYELTMRLRISILGACVLNPASLVA